ncbi:SLATT domain-containing protein [Kitasatospora sp. NPDC088134]|uniref:SLATT domain-containing protein n=1 Tax=Kitasatospora sp. NPDC088134 TaxID=3364071 RepID=UPI0037F1F051
MDAETAATQRKLAWLEVELDAELKERRRRRDWDRRRALTLQMATVSLSALVTVLLGLKVGEPAARRFADAALVSGALVTVLAAWAAFFGYRTLWIQRSDTVHRLTSLRRRLALLKAEYGPAVPEPSRLAPLIDEYQRIIEDDHDSWVRLRQSEAGGSAT